MQLFQHPPAGGAATAADHARRGADFCLLAYGPAAGAFLSSPAAHRRPYSIARPIQPPCDPHGRWEVCG